MRSSPAFITLFLLATSAYSCKKHKATAPCSPDNTTIRTITDKKAVIQVTATVNPAWIIEEGSTDTKLIPCNLPMEFYQNGLQVVISGDVKLTVQDSQAPCCNQSFIITKITR